MYPASTVCNCRTSHFFLLCVAFSYRDTYLQVQSYVKLFFSPKKIFDSRQASALRPSFMGIVFGVYRNWIWEFGDLKSDTPILWGSIWPNTMISNPIFFFSPWLHRIWDPNTMESRTIVFAVFDLTCRRVPLKVRSHHQA